MPVCVFVSLLAYSKKFTTQSLQYVYSVHCTVFSAVPYYPDYKKKCAQKNPCILECNIHQKIFNLNKLIYNNLEIETNEV